MRFNCGYTEEIKIKYSCMLRIFAMFKHYYVLGTTISPFCCADFVDIIENIFSKMSITKMYTN
ncbi:MAG: hypothetical protein ABIK61_07740 [candidate division WOR-3 bacterium]